MSQFNVHGQVNKLAFEMIRRPHLEFSPFEDENKPAKKRKKYENSKQSNQYFSGDSQDNSKGNKSISVREPLRHIRTTMPNQGSTNQQNYAAVSEASDDMYAAIEDPTYIPTGNQSNSDTSDDDEELPEFTSKMNEEIKKIMLSSSSTVVEGYGIRIEKRDLETLQGINWLNDKIINYYLEMIAERSTQNQKWQNVNCLDSFFLPTLIGNVETNALMVICSMVSESKL